MTNFYINFNLSFFTTTFGLLMLMLFLMLSLLLIHYKNLKMRENKNLPPGEMGSLPWIGETLVFYKAQQKNQLFDEFFKPRIEKYGEIFKTNLMGSPTIVVNGAEANKFFLSNEFKLVVSSWPSSAVELMGKDCIMEKQGEAHRFLRGVIMTSLGSEGLKSLVPKICKSTLIHLDKYWGTSNDETSLYKSSKVLTFSIVFECLLGIEVEEGMLSAFERVLEGIFAFKYLPGFSFSRAKKARKEIEDRLVEVVRKKKNEIMTRGINRNDETTTLLSRLVCGMIRGEISEKEVVDNVVLLVFAAHDTTSFAIAMTFRMLAQNPKSHSRLLQEHDEIRKNQSKGEMLTIEDTQKMQETWKVVRESLRLFPPIFGSFRKTITDINYQGHTIPKGWKILWTTYGTHYNKDYFKNPMEFDPSRFDEAIKPYVFVAFGGGPRLCGGYQLAKLNILIFVHYVLSRYDWDLLFPQEPIIMDPLPIPSLGMPIKVSLKST